MSSTLMSTATTSLHIRTSTTMMTLLTVTNIEGVNRVSSLSFQTGRIL